MTDQNYCNLPDTEGTLHPLVIGAKDFAALLQVSSRTIWRLVSSGEAPKPVRIGGSCRWRLDEIKDWISSGCPSPHAK